MKKIGKPILNPTIVQNTASCVSRTTNHELWNKRAEVKLKEEYAFVREIKAGKGFTENEKTSFEAFFGTPFSKSSDWLRLVYAGRTYFERQGV